MKEQAKPLALYIQERKQTLYKAIRRDQAIKADAYTNWARVKELERVEKVIKKGERR